MKRALSAVLAVCLIFASFVGCGQKAKTVDYDLEALASKLLDDGGFSDLLAPITKDIAASFYSFDDAEVSECVIYCSTGATTEEIALFKCDNEDAAAKLKANAEKRVETQKTIYESYAPAEPPKLDEAIVEQNGLYVFYIVSADSGMAQAVLDSFN